jgi:hypothetical protein
LAAGIVLAAASAACAPVQQEVMDGSSGGFVDPTGAWFQSRDPVGDGCDFGGTAERVLWELDGSLLRTTGEACETAMYPYAENRVTDVRTVEATFGQPECRLTAEITTELLFQSTSTYVGSVAIVGVFSGSCAGGCTSSFDVSGSRCADPGPCTPDCGD